MDMQQAMGAVSRQKGMAVTGDKGAAQLGQKDSMKVNTTPAADRRKADGSADPLGANSEIGRKLRQYYEELASEEVPEKFADLLKQLENREKTATSQNGE